MTLLDKIAAAGVVGCGGAGFPTHIKLKGPFEYLIVNGAECEPLLRNDRYLMRNHAPALVEAVSAIASEQRIPHAVIALKHHYRDEAAALRAAIAQAGANIKIYELESFYPAGDEQTIVYEVTGRVVPPAGLPGEVGAVVSNVATIYAVYEALHGVPFTQKYLTITGEVKTPAILKVPVGTSIRRCLALAGGALRSDFLIVTGGPMMGRPLPMDMLDDAMVTKTTSGILVLPTDGYHAASSMLQTRHMLNRARSACIQCTACTQLCPRHLLGHPLEPHRIMRTLSAAADIQSLLSDSAIRGAQLCCECGVCETYACPMGLQPRKINSLVKQELAKAGIRYQRTQTQWTPHPSREERKAPSARAAARVGVLSYYNYEITDLICGEPDEVRIPVKMHTGVPAVPVVSAGDPVQAGMAIALPPEGALGAVIHASISGRVKAVGDVIAITRE